MADKTQTTQQKVNLAGHPQMSSSWSEVQRALGEIQNTFGFVPKFVDAMTETSIPGAWYEVKNLFYAKNTALDTKVKDLIGLAVAVQMPSEMLMSMNNSIGKSDGVTQQEQAEAILMGAITRHWSTVLNGSLQDHAEFRREADQIMAYVERMMESGKGQMPAQENFLVSHTTADETYQDIKNTMGLVPKFMQNLPEEAISGAWSEFKAVQLNPYTAIASKNKELIGLAVASQIPCEYCIYFHTKAAKLFGASDREVKEAIALAAISRHWATVFQGSALGMDEFNREVDRMVHGSQETRQLHS